MFRMAFPWEEKNECLDTAMSKRNRNGSMKKPIVTAVLGRISATMSP
jgi:hypothetical protein